MRGHPGERKNGPYEWTCKCLDQKLDLNSISLMSHTLLPHNLKDPQPDPNPL